MHGLGKCGFLDKTAVQKQSDSFTHGIFHEQVVHSEIVLMLLFAHKDAAAYPPSTELQLDLFSPARMMGFALLICSTAGAQRLLVLTVSSARAKGS